MRDLRELRCFLERILDVTGQNGRLPAAQLSKMLTNLPPNLEQELSAHLGAFFSRYYDDNGYFSPSCLSGASVPMAGQLPEFGLHWKNMNQYYVNTWEYLPVYAFCLPSGGQVRLIVAGDWTGSDRRGAGDDIASRGKLRNRKLVLRDELPVEFNQKELRIFFKMQSQQQSQYILNKQAAQRILTILQGAEQAGPTAESLGNWGTELQLVAATAQDPGRILLEKHLHKFASGKGFEYYIHKNIGAFLRRELDLYIHDEVKKSSNTAGSQERAGLEHYLAQVEALRNCGYQIIGLLERAENRRKRIFLQKKIVVETNYCLTLDRVPEELYPEIAVNTAQLAEWERLYAIDDLVRFHESRTGGGFSKEFLKANPNLVLDTKFFSRDFIDRLVATFHDLDDAIDGLLVHADNLQALNLLHARYHKTVRCIYIDPPYNTEKNTTGNKFLYKDNYSNSGWLSLMRDRLEACRVLCRQDAVLFASIDENELYYLGALLESIFAHRVGIFTWVKKKKGSHLSKTVRDMTEYVLAYAIDKRSLELYGEQAYSNKMQPLAKRTNKRKNLFFAAGTVETTLPDGTYPGGSYGRGTSALTFEDDFNVVKGRVVSSVRINGPFVWVQERLDRELKLGTKVVLSRAFGLNILRHDQAARVKRPSTLLDSTAGIGTNEDATRDLIDMFGREGMASYPKPVSLIGYLVNAVTYNDPQAIVLDFFAGSGSTGQAVLELNRQDGGQRKYILVEKSAYFDTLLKSRLQKAIYSADWRDGRPVVRRGVSHMFKYIRLQSYEEAAARSMGHRSGEQPDLSTAGSPGDVVETFNYLIGLTVKQIRTTADYKIITGIRPDGQQAVVVWRNPPSVGIPRSDQNRPAILPSFRDMINANDCRIYINAAELPPFRKELDNGLGDCLGDWKVHSIEEEFRRQWQLPLW